MPLLGTRPQKKEEIQEEISQEEQDDIIEEQSERQFEAQEDRMLEEIRFGQTSMHAESTPQLFAEFIKSPGLSVVGNTKTIITEDAKAFMKQLAEMLTQEMVLSNITEDDYRISLMPRYRLAGYAFEQGRYKTGAAYAADLVAILKIKRSIKGFQQEKVVTIRKEHSKQQEGKDWK